MIDSEVWLQGMLAGAAICVLVLVGMVMATGYYLCQARQLWRQMQRGHEVVRDQNGRPVKERK